MIGNIKKYWWVYGVFTAIIGTIAWIFTQGGISNEKDSRLFTTPKIRIETETYMEQRPSPAQEMRQIMLDSFAAVTSMKNDSSAMLSRAMRDSTYLEEVKARKVTDSILLLNADQSYQIKEEIRKINKKIDIRHE